MRTDERIEEMLRAYGKTNPFAGEERVWRQIVAREDGKKARPFEKRRLVPAVLVLASVLAVTVGVAVGWIEWPRLTARQEVEIESFDGEEIRQRVAIYNRETLDPELPYTSLRDSKFAYMETIEEAQAVTPFPIVQLGYIPENAEFWRGKIMQYTNGKYQEVVRQSYHLYPGSESFFFVEQWYVGPEAYMDIQSVREIEEIQGANRSYIVLPYDYAEEVISSALWWIEGTYVFQVFHPDIDEAVRIADALVIRPVESDE